MQWSDYKKISSGIYAPEASKPTSIRSKLIVAEGLSSKNLLRMPGKLSAPQVSMESDLRKFISGKPILNEVAPLVPLVVPAIAAAGESAAVAGAGAAATGAAATGGVGAAGVAGEAAAAGGTLGAAGSTIGPTATGGTITGAAETGTTAAGAVGDSTSAANSLAADSTVTAKPTVAQTNNASTAWDVAQSVANNTTVDDHKDENEAKNKSGL